MMTEWIKSMGEFPLTPLSAADKQVLEEETRKYTVCA